MSTSIKSTTDTTSAPEGIAQSGVPKARPGGGPAMLNSGVPGGDGGDGGGAGGGLRWEEASQYAEQHSGDMRLPVKLSQRQVISRCM